jgi:hypothetical protein
VEDDLLKPIEIVAQPLVVLRDSRRRRRLVCAALMSSTWDCHTTRLTAI